MVGNSLLIAGALLILSLAIGQLLVRRRQTANKVLTILFVITFLWISHGIGYRFGLLDIMPHFNKVYLPLLCITGSLWYTYVRCLHDEVRQSQYSVKYLLMPLLCVLLSVPFYMQKAQYKRVYIETELADWPSIFMYGATRVAELTVLWFFIKTTLFLHRLPEHRRPIQHIGVSRTLFYLSITAAVGAATRIVGSIVGDKTISVLYPCLISIAVIVVMHVLSYRSPVVLSLSHSSRTIKIKPEGAINIQSIQNKMRTHEWYLDPDLKVQSLARHVGMPSAELSALINSVTGTNFNEFINQYRIDYAKKLLSADTKKSVLDVAYESGYNSKSAFYKHFTAVTTMTPVQYRKSCHVDAEVS